MLHETVHWAAETAAVGGIDFLYILIPALFGGYGISTIISHLTKRGTEKGAQSLEGTRLGQDIMEKAMIRLDKEVTDLRNKDIKREAELVAVRAVAETHQITNNALVRYLAKMINAIKMAGGTVPLVDPEDVPYLEELSKFAKADNE